MMPHAMPRHRDAAQAGLGAFVCDYLDGRKIQHNAIGEALGWTKQKTYRFLQFPPDSATSRGAGVAPDRGPRPAT